MTEIRCITCYFTYYFIFIAQFDSKCILTIKKASLAEVLYVLTISRELKTNFRSLFIRVEPVLWRSTMPRQNNSVSSSK